MKTQSPGRSTGDGVQSVRRIAALLNALRDSRCGLNVSEISRRTGIHKSTTSRLLASMLHENLVDHDEETRLYRLGTGIVAMAAGVEPDMFLRHAARPYLARVNDETGETATLSIFDDYEVLTIDEIAGPSTLRFVAWTGMRTPLHASASGKCLLAFSPPEIFEHYLSSHELLARTPHTITSRSALIEEIEQTRARGYGIVFDELEEGVAAFSAPIRDFSGRMLGVLNVTWPTFRVSDEERQRFASVLLDAAHELSSVFGYQADE